MFQVGDRVQCVKVATTYDYRVLGMMGTIRLINGEQMGVEWDKRVLGGHSLGGKTLKSGTGWWVKASCLALVEEEDSDSIDADAFAKILSEKQ